MRELISAPEQSLLLSLSYQRGLQTGEGHPRYPELEHVMWIQALATPETSTVSCGVYLLELQETALLLQERGFKHSYPRIHHP